MWEYIIAVVIVVVLVIVFLVFLKKPVDNTPQKTFLWNPEKDLNPNTLIGLKVNGDTYLAAGKCDGKYIVQQSSGTSVRCDTPTTITVGAIGRGNMGGSLFKIVDMPGQTSNAVWGKKVGGVALINEPTKFICRARYVENGPYSLGFDEGKGCIITGATGPIRDVDYVNWK